tara:strand:- start:3683 stop:4801 length:1119 start_codon:yes stop_codon:yes gene_type:complete
MPKKHKLAATHAKLWLLGLSISALLGGCVSSEDAMLEPVSTSAEKPLVSPSREAIGQRVTQASFHQPARVGPYEIFDPKALSVLDVSAPIDVLATGFEWLEGPVWSSVDNVLLFSDIPTHKVYRYQEGPGVSEFLSHSGFSNGLLINNQQELILLQSRSRQIARLRLALSAAQRQAFTPDDYHVLMDNYHGHKLNSPNDGVLSRGGTLYFTDPPYGLPKQLDDPAKELDFQGVYALSPSGVLTLLDKSLKYPNGIALSKDEKSLYVAASNPDKPAWYRYSLSDDGKVKHRELFYQASVIGGESHGLPDGLKVHASGFIFATGPNGIWLFDPSGRLLAKIHMPSTSANVAFNADQSKVFVTAHHQLLSFNLKP